MRDIVGTLGAGAMSWWQRWLRWGRSLDDPAPIHETAERHRITELVARTMPIYAGMPADQRLLLVERTRRLYGRLEYIARTGATLTEELRVLVAAQASVLLLGFPDERGYRRVSAVVLHPSAFGESTSVVGPDGSRYVVNGWVAGRAWELGIVELDWSSVQRSLAQPGDGYNVVYHEFAHALDGADGHMGGTPPLPTWEMEREWSVTMAESLTELSADLAAGRWAPLSPYAATSLTEFFAVATEAFFERPHALERWRPALFDLLRRYYNQDPRAFLKPIPEPDTPAQTGIQAS